MGFTVAVGTGRERPRRHDSGVVRDRRRLAGITRGGAPVSCRVETIKGVTYAIFSAVAGTYLANYGVDTTAPMHFRSRGDSRR